jgi:hypothetical protein
VTQQPKRLPGEPNPVTDADTAIQPVRDAQYLGRESLAMGSGLHGGPFGTGEGGVVKSLVALLDRRQASPGRQALALNDGAGTAGDIHVCRVERGYARPDPRLDIVPVRGR